MINIGKELKRLKTKEYWKEVGEYCRTGHEIDSITRLMEPPNDLTKKDFLPIATPFIICIIIAVIIIVAVLAFR